MALSRHRLWRDDHGPAFRRSHDQFPRSAARQQSARDRHRLGLPVRVSREPHGQSVLDRDHQALGRADAEALRCADRARYSEYKGITTKNADGYYGWKEEAPF